MDSNMIQKAFTLFLTPFERFVRYCILKPIWGKQYDEKKFWQPEGPLV